MPLLILYILSALWRRVPCNVLPLVFYAFEVFFFCLLASLCLASSVSVSLLVFFWKITRSGAVRVHVFCAGYIDWMGWLHWAGFLCGPPANFMIYSAKGRGARPPVTTERELHVGLMISPQKCLLWLGLHGAQSPPTGWMVGRRWGGGGLKRELGWPAWVNTNAYHYTSTWRDYKGRRGRTESYIRVACSKCFKLPSFNKTLSESRMRVVILYHAFCYFSPPPPPFTILVASGRFQRHYWNVDTEDDVTKLSRTGRGAEIIGGVRETRLGWGGGWGGEVFGIFFSAGVQVCWLKRVTAEGLDLDATLGAASLSVCLATTPPEQDDVIQRDLWAFLIKRQNHGGKPNYAARVWTGQGATPLLGFFWGGKHVGPASAHFFKMNIFPSCLSIKTKCPQNVFIYFIDFDARESPQTKAVYNQINDGCIPPSYFGVSGTLRAGSQLTETLE